MKITEKMLNSLPKPTERLQALENNIMEKLFDEKISRQVLNTKHTNTMHDKTNNSDITLINRTIDKMENTKDASVFDIPKEEIIENTIMDFIPAITIWLTNESNETLTINIKQDETIGHGITYRNEKLEEYTTQNLTVVLEKDDNSPIGFLCKTAYPDITPYTKNKTPTNRNLIPDLIQTRTFKNADTKTRKQLIQAAINGLDRQLTPIEHIHTDIIRHRAYTDNMQITMDNDNITIHHPNTDGYSTLYISTKETDITNGCTPELNRLKIFVENKFKLQSKRVLTKSKMAKIEEEIYKFPNISENTEKQPGS